jgi:hypothetical protein
MSVLTVLNNADSGTGSLRAAIAAAQSGDTIVFDPTLTYQTITLSSGPLALSSNLTIDGLGANQLTINGDHASQLFTLSGTAQVILANLTLTGGMSSQGGAISVGGGTALTLNSDILSGNQAVGDANGNALGGAVYNSAGARLTIDNTAFVNNQSNGKNVSFGGALANAGSLVIVGTTFAGNTALGSTTPVGNPQPGGSQGGAIGNLDGATATIKSSTFTGNQALGNDTGDAQGGALCNEDAWVFPFTGSGVTLTMSQCTFANNTAMGGSNAAIAGGSDNGGDGGAIEDNPGVSLAVLDCSFTGNQANSGGGVNAGGAAGGAIENAPAVTVTISASQFISNSAIGRGLGAGAYAGAVDNLQTMTIDNCLFTGNSAMAGPMADGVNTFAQGFGGAIFSGFGLFTGVSPVLLTLSNSIIADNVAIGGSGGSTLMNAALVDTAFGGGINNGVGGTMNITGCTITGNQAIGGASGEGTGGDAFGGGIRNDLSGNLNLTNSTVSANLCQAGQGAPGAAGGIASGAGLDNERGSIAILTNSTISLNVCVGGLGGAGANGGAAVGAGVANAVYPFAYGIADASSLVMSNCQLIGNMAQGGTAGSSAVGGDGLGGGLFAGGGTVVLKGVLVSGNQAQGGVDSQGNTTGQGLGGGLYVDPSANVTADVETLIAGNQASKSNNDVWGSIAIVP